MKDELLKLDMELLLLRYGRQRVLSALADLEDWSVQSLEVKLASLRTKKLTRQVSKAGKSLVEILQDKVADDPSRLASLRPIVIGYENGTLLPSLKAVQRFFESRGETPPKAKSRKLAGQAFLNLILDMDAADLDDLRRKNVDDGQSDFSLLSKAILGGQAR